MTTLINFVASLKNTAVSPTVANPYQQLVQRHNLRRYLARMQEKRPSLLLVGEAPGYRGCRLTGIPFVSPAILRDHPFFSVANGYRLPTEQPHVQRESSATIVWQTLDQLDALPLLWNAFPLHPHKTSQPQSNRGPTKKEIEEKRPLFHHLLTLFPSLTTLIAVGNKADQTLTRWHIPHHKIRHPSHGGKADFQAGLLTYCNSNQKRVK